MGLSDRRPQTRPQDMMDRQQILSGPLRAATATREEGKAVSYAESVEWGKGEGGVMGDVKMVEQAGREGRGKTGSQLLPSLGQGRRSAR